MTLYSSTLYNVIYIARGRPSIRNVCREYTQSPYYRKGGEDAVGNPHQAHFFQFELFELFLFFKLDKRFSIEQFEATVSQSTVPSLPLKYAQSPYQDYDG